MVQYSVAELNTVRDYVFEKLGSKKPESMTIDELLVLLASDLDKAQNN